MNKKIFFLIIFCLALFVLPSSSNAMTGRCIGHASLDATSNEMTHVYNPDPKRCKTGASKNYSPVASNLVCYVSGSFCLGSVYPCWDKPPFVYGQNQLIAGTAYSSIINEYQLKINDYTSPAPGDDSTYDDNSGGIKVDVIFPNKIKRFINGAISGVTGVFGTWGTPEIRVASGVIKLTANATFGRKLTCKDPITLTGNLKDVVGNVLVIFTDGSKLNLATSAWNFVGGKLQSSVKMPTDGRTVAQISGSICAGSDSIDPYADFEKDLYYPLKSCSPISFGTDN